MFDFLKEIDYILVRIITDINNNIKVQNGYTLVSIQSFCEMILKHVNNKEKILLDNKLTLGDFLNDREFVNFIELDLSLDSLQLSRINNIANDIKHNGNNKFDKKEIEVSYRYIYKLAIAIYNRYNDNKLEYNYESNCFEELLNQYEKEKKEIIKRIEEQNLKSRELIEAQLKEAETKKEIFEKRIAKYEKEKSEYTADLVKLNKLEIELNKKSNELYEIKKNKSELEKQINESNNKEKSRYQKTIEELEIETKKLKIEIAALREKDILDKTEKIDRDKKILSEKEIEIQELKALLGKKEIVENETLFDLFKKTSLQIGFSSSYVEDDSYFVINGVYNNTQCMSKYKSFYAVLCNLLQRGTVISKGKYLSTKELEDKELKEIIRLQLCILSLIRNNRLKDKKWSINYINGNIKLLKIALEDIFTWIELITTLASVKYERPELDLTSEEYNYKYINIKYDNKFELEKDIYTICDQIVTESEDIYDFFNIWVDDYIYYDIGSHNKRKLMEFMKLVFGYEDFNQGQFEILTHTLNGESTIGILPTGGGKSLIYQMSSLLEPKITIVVAPINGLIKDQIDGLKRKFGITRCLNITSSNEDKAKDEKMLRKANAMFVFTSPERFQMETFRKILLNLAENRSIEKIVLDEVHCLSEWGHDFRIPYLMLAETLIRYCGVNIKYLGLTATASSAVIKDLLAELNLNTSDVVYLEKLKRTNLKFGIRKYRDSDEMQLALTRKIDEINPELNGEDTNAMIVFARTKSGKDPTCINRIEYALNDLYEDELARYDGDHKDSQDAFINNEKSLLIATKAFGMGIDKPNIRCTVHYGMPSSFENFYQEAGRAGRDKKPAECYIYTYDTHFMYKGLVNEFFDPGTSIKRLKEIQKLVSGKTDLSTNFFFFANKLKTPAEDAGNAQFVYHEILKKQKNLIANLADNEDWDREKYLYILHKLGIVNNWEKNYSTHTLTVYLNSKFDNLEHIKASTKKYIAQYELDEKTLNNLLNEIDNTLIKEPDKISVLVEKIREWYSDKFVYNRKEQMAVINERVEDYANTECSAELQELIDRYFDLTNTINKTAEGYSLVFEYETLTNVARYAAELPIDKLKRRSIEMERILESNITENINLYTSLIFLRNNNFDSRNGCQRFDALYKNTDEVNKVEIYHAIAKDFYNKITDEQKETLLNHLYNLDTVMFRSVFLENVEEDNISKKYWIPYINENLKELFKGGK